MWTLSPSADRAQLGEKLAELLTGADALFVTEGESGGFQEGEPEGATAGGFSFPSPTPRTDAAEQWSRLQTLVVAALELIPLRENDGDHPQEKEEEASGSADVFLTREDVGQAAVLSPAVAPRLSDQVRAAVAGALQCLAVENSMRVAIAFRVFLIYGESFSADLAPMGQPVFAALEQIRARMPPPACGRTWSEELMVVTCYTCASDQTCCFCMDCFESETHEGHDYRIHGSLGGMCDCGDPEAWDPKGFCAKHRGAREDFKASEVLSPFGELFARSALRGLMDVAVTHSIELCRGDFTTISALVNKDDPEARKQQDSDMLRSSLRYDAIDEATWLRAHRPVDTKHPAIAVENVAAGLRGSLMLEVDLLLSVARSGNSELWGVLMSAEFASRPTVFAGEPRPDIDVAAIAPGGSTLDFLFLLHNYLPQPARLILHELYHVLVPSYAFKHVAIRHFATHYPHLLREAGSRAYVPARYEESGDILDLGAQIITVPSVCMSVSAVTDLEVFYGLGQIRVSDKLPRNIVSIMAGELAAVIEASSGDSRFIDHSHALMEDGAYWTPYIDLKYALQNASVSSIMCGFPDGNPASASTHPVTQAWGSVIVPRIVARAHGGLPLIRRARGSQHVLREPRFLNAINFEINVARLCEVIATRLAKVLVSYLSSAGDAPDARETAMRSACESVIVPLVRSLHEWLRTSDNLPRFDTQYRVADTSTDLLRRFGYDMEEDFYGVSMHISLHRALSNMFQSLASAKLVDVTREKDISNVFQLCFDLAGLDRNPDTFAASLLAEPLRIQVWMTQATYGLWSRNGSQCMAGYEFR
jgi:Putative zinc finger in N-recognin (UBR box)